MLTEYDYRLDSKCGDPDQDSKKLYEMHVKLWSKKLPNGDYLDLIIEDKSFGNLYLMSNNGTILASDRMCPHFVGACRGKFDGWLTEDESEELQYKVRTIGGHIIFPAIKNNGYTINQARGINRKILDRFDLTLECIRRYYKNETSPLYATLLNYRDFLDLFVNFKGYIDFFLLQDFVDIDEQINFSIPFDNFNRSPFPQTKEEYKLYKEHTIHLINSRNKRIFDTVN